MGVTTTAEEDLEIAIGETEATANAFNHVVDTFIQNVKTDPASREKREAPLKNTFATFLFHHQSRSTPEAPISEELTKPLIKLWQKAPASFAFVVTLTENDTRIPYLIRVLSTVFKKPKAQLAFIQELLKAQVFLPDNVNAYLRGNSFFSNYVTAVSKQLFDTKDGRQSYKELFFAGSDFSIFETTLNPDAPDAEVLRKYQEWMVGFLNNVRVLVKNETLPPTFKDIIKSIADAACNHRGTSLGIQKDREDTPDLWVRGISSTPTTSQTLVSQAEALEAKADKNLAIASDYALQIAGGFFFLRLINPMLVTRDKAVHPESLTTQGLANFQGTIVPAIQKLASGFANNEPTEEASITKKMLQAWYDDPRNKVAMRDLLNALVRTNPATYAEARFVNTLAPAVTPSFVAPAESSTGVTSRFPWKKYLSAAAITTIAIAACFFIPGLSDFLLEGSVGSYVAFASMGGVFLGVLGGVPFYYSQHSTRPNPPRDIESVPSAGSPGKGLDEADDDISSVIELNVSGHHSGDELSDDGSLDDEETESSTARVRRQLFPANGSAEEGTANDTESEAESDEADEADVTPNPLDQAFTGGASSGEESDGELETSQPGSSVSANGNGDTGNPSPASRI